jgi:hypothetical protein
MRKGSVCIGEEQEGQRRRGAMDDNNITDYDNALGRDAGIASVQRTQPRSSWWILAMLLIIFGVLCVTTGIRCANSTSCVIVDEVQPCGTNLTCVVYQVPSLGTLLNNNETSALAISALDTLVVMHVLLTINVILMVRGYSWVPVALMTVSVIAMYIMLYASFIVGQWYISICPMGALALWCASVVLGLRRYYYRQPRKPLFWFSLAAMLVFTAGVLLYISFSAVSSDMLPGRDIAILASQLTMAVSCVVFVISVAFHTRCVSYEAVVARDVLLSSSNEV